MKDLNASLRDVTPIATAFRAADCTAVGKTRHQTLRAYSTTTYSQRSGLTVFDLFFREAKRQPRGRRASV